MNFVCDIPGSDIRDTRYAWQPAQYLTRQYNLRSCVNTLYPSWGFMVLTSLRPQLIQALSQLTVTKRNGSETKKFTRGCRGWSRKTLGLVDRWQSGKVVAHQQHPLSKAQCLVPRMPQLSSGSSCPRKWASSMRTPKKEQRPPQCHSLFLRASWPWHIYIYIHINYLHIKYEIYHMTLRLFGKPSSSVPCIRFCVEGGKIYPNKEGRV